MAVVSTPTKGGHKKKKAKARPAQQADFKKIKARVGVKAPKPANLTDTTVKAAALRLKSSNSTTTTGHVSESASLTGGRSVLPLIRNLQHSASATVRLSAVRELRDFVTNPSTAAAAQQELQQLYLAELIPACAKCCIDGHNEVRTAGLTILREVAVLAKTDCSTTPTSKRGVAGQPSATTAQYMMRPFVPLLIAYATSALHSLDRPTRWHGAAVVEWLSHTVPDRMRSQIWRLLPALTRLLAENPSMDEREKEISTLSRTSFVDKSSRRTPTAHHANGEEQQQQQCPIFFRARRAATDAPACCRLVAADL